jgi:hypothetical protein
MELERGLEHGHRFLSDATGLLDDGYRFSTVPPVVPSV